MSSSKFFARGGLALALLMTCSSCLSSSGVADADKLSISKVVLYQNGVGYFERKGQVSGSEFSIRVRPDQINDVLKSLTILERGGSRASSVSFPVERSSDRLARELPSQVRNARGMLQMLQVMRGTRVQIATKDRDYDGRVVGVEKDGKTARLTLLTSAREMVTLKTSDLRRLQILDAALAQGLSRSLDIARDQGRWKPVTVTLRFADDGPHNLLVSYIQEVPVWRSAYRAWVSNAEPVRLSGWAIVDNVSGEDWRDIQLSMAGGSPLSFRYELHRPHHVRRPSLNHRLPRAAQAPPQSRAGYKARRRRVADKAATSRRVSGRLKGRRGRKGFSAKRENTEDRIGGRWSKSQRHAAIARSAQTLVKGRQVGALYSYDSMSPVTVPDGKAALIPIVNRKMQGEDVFYFPQTSKAYRAVRLTADKAAKGSAGTLESGPITLYVNGTFAGEGFLPRLAAGQTAFVPYSLDNSLSVRMRRSQKDADVRLVKVHDGKVSVSYKRRRIHQIEVLSRRNKASIAYVKMRRSRGTQLAQVPKGCVSVGRDFFVRVEVGPNEKGSVTVIEQSPVNTVTSYASGLTLTAMRLHLRGIDADDATRGPVEAFLQAHSQLNRLRQSLHPLRRKRMLLERGGARLRANLKALPKGSVAARLRARLLKQLSQNNAMLARITKDMIEIDVKVRESNDKLRELLKQVELR
ncbi:MAG: hypothetical protein CMH53_08055 [Myxococcales bacterium]|nr:hypothetical protein [Myxococcales bacterium]